MRGARARGAPTRLDRCARAGGPGQQPRRDGRAGCAVSAGSTRSPPPACAPKSATSHGSRSPLCCPGSSASYPASTPPTTSASRARSPRPGRRTRGGCWSRPRTTTVTGPLIGVGLAARQAGQDPRVVQIAWRANAACTQRWAHLAGTRGKQHRHRRDRLRTRARRVLLGGRDPGLNTQPTSTTRAGRLPGRHEQPRRPPRRRSTGPRPRAMGNPASPAGPRPLLDCEPGDEQGS